jgi:hypothetical protein
VRIEQPLARKLAATVVQRISDEKIRMSTLCLAKLTNAYRT